MTRRGIVVKQTLSLLLAASSIALLAQAAPAATVDRDAKIVIGWAEPPDALNPATTGARDVGPLDVNLFNTLVWITPDFKVTPDLATSWTFAPDGKTLTFELRHDVTFHDGTPFDAAAVVANIAYITDPATQSKSALGLLGPCKTATATGQYTVAFTCTAPYAPLLAHLGEPYASMQSPTAIKKWGKDLGLHPTGTGPFKFVSYTPNQSLVVERNDAYKWGPEATGHSGPPDIAQITFDIVPNSQARINQFQTGQSVLMQETPGVFWNALNAGGRYTAVPVPISGMGIFAPINASQWPTNDLAVRKAIMFAVDKNGVSKLADAGAHPISNTPLEKGMTAYDPSLEDMYSYDPDKAAALLKADGWTKTGKFWEKDGKPLTIKLTAIATVPEYPLLAQAIQGYLIKFGMDASVEQLAVPAWLAANIKGDINMTPLQFVDDDPDGLHFWFLPNQYFNWSHYTNPDLTKLLTEGQQETDPAKRIEIYKAAQKIIMDQAVEMPLHLNIDLVMTSKNLTGLTWEGGGFEYFGAAAMTK
jgi:peptide/nickel transport system substrate-binding protein